MGHGPFQYPPWLTTYASTRRCPESNPCLLATGIGAHHWLPCCGWSTSCRPAGRSLGGWWPLAGGHPTLDWWPVIRPSVQWVGWILPSNRDPCGMSGDLFPFSILPAGEARVALTRKWWNTREMEWKKEKSRSFFLMVAWLAKISPWVLDFLFLLFFFFLFRFVCWFLYYFLWISPFLSASLWDTHYTNTGICGSKRESCIRT